MRPLLVTRKPAACEGKALAPASVRYARRESTYRTPWGNPRGLA
jgi:hypothetical protein